MRRYAPPGPAADPWGVFLREAAGEYGVPVDLLYAVMGAESHGCQWLNGHPITGAAGEVGLMQIPPAIYAGYSRGPTGGGPDPFLPRDNIRAAAWTLAGHIRRFGLPYALAAYQWGPTELAAAQRDGRLVPGATQGYLRDVWAEYGDRAARSARGASQPMAGPTHCIWVRRP